MPLLSLHPQTTDPLPPLPAYTWAQAQTPDWLDSFETWLEHWLGW